MCAVTSVNVTRRVWWLHQNAGALLRARRLVPCNYLMRTHLPSRFGIDGNRPRSALAALEGLTSIQVPESGDRVPVVTVSGAFFQTLEATSTWRPSVPSLTVVAAFWWRPALTSVSLPWEGPGFLPVLHGAKRALHAGMPGRRWPGRQ